MKKIPFVICFMAIGFSFFQSCKNGQTPPAPATPSVTSAPNASNTAFAAAKIAFVNVDTLQEKYTYFKQQKASFEQKESNLTASIEGKIQQLQREMMALQEKAQKGTVPPAELQKEGQALQAKEQALIAERDRRAKGLLDETAKFNESLMKKINDVLAQLQKEKGFDYVLRHTEGGGSPVLFVNPQYDITYEVLTILNNTTPK